MFVNITTNDRSFACPIIYTDTSHITSNDCSFGCPIIYTDTSHITSNDCSFGCPIIYTDTSHITSNDCSFGCPIIYTDTIHITSNDCSFGCPILYTDIIHYAILFIDTSNNALYKQVHSPAETPYLAIIASNDNAMKILNSSMLSCTLDAVDIAFKAHSKFRYI